MTKDFSAVVMAAGKGTRFKSEKIKVLHQMLGKSMLHLIIDSLSGLDPDSLMVIVGHQKELIMKEKFARPVQFAVQKRPLGTADAVLAVKDLLEGQEEKDVLVMNADLPLVQTGTLQPLLDFHRQGGNALTFLTGLLEDPTGFGRVILGEEGVLRIVEERDATPGQRKIKESNLGVYCFNVGELFQSLPKISNRNAKGEYYLTDIIEIMMRDGKKCRPFKTENTDEFIGVNDRNEFRMATEVLRKRKLRSLREKGVKCLDEESCWVDLDVPVGEETVIHPDVVIQGDSAVGSGCCLHSHVRINNSHLGHRVLVGESAIVERSSCGDGSQISPHVRVVDRIIQPGEKPGEHTQNVRSTGSENGNEIHETGKHRGGS